MECIGCCLINTFRPRQNGRHFVDGILKCIFVKENAWMSINISLKFVPKGPINNIPVLVQVMAWRRPGDNPLSESRMVSLLTHICLTRPQWVNGYFNWQIFLGPVSRRLMTSQFKDIVTHTQNMKTVKCIVCHIWVQNFVWNFKGALWNFTQNFEPIPRKICILRGVINLTTYDILKLWHLKS